MFMTAWVFEPRHCPTLLNEIKKTKLQIYASPQPGLKHFVMGWHATPLLNYFPELLF
jgi:hypothetical protein